MAENDLLDRERLMGLTEEMIGALTSPPFVEAMRTMKASPDEERLGVAAQILTPKALRDQGVPLPEDMRITSRYFEAHKPTIEVSDHFVRLLPGEVPDSGDTCGCACGGGLTVCGGAGGGSGKPPIME